jgi:plastocyanin
MPMKNARQALVGFLIGLAITRLALPVRAEEASGPPTRAEFNKLQTEVREQRQLIIQMLQTEQQRYDMLLKLLSGQGGGTALVAPPAPAAPAAAAEPESGDSGSSKRAERIEHVRGGGAAASEHRNAALEGKVTFSDGAPGEIYVYVENIRGPLARGRALEVKQEGKQFIPRVAVVQAGTTVTFPNFDTVYHNVFSSSPRNSFDLGTYQAGEKPHSVTLTSSGVVDVFCNIHQKMSAKILVVPNTLYTKVKPDGTFRIENVPVGQRRVIAWSPTAKASQQKVEVTPQGANITFALQREDPAAHANKFGQAYGSYRD